MLILKNKRSKSLMSKFFSNSNGHLRMIRGLVLKYCNIRQCDDAMMITVLKSLFNTGGSEEGFNRRIFHNQSI